MGHIVVTPATVFTDCRTIIPTVLHSLKLQILSRCRTHPVDLASIMRGVIDESDLRTLRVAGTTEAYMGASASPVQPEAWGSTDKHKVLWLVPAILVQEAIKGKGKGKGKGAGDKGSKGNTGSQGDKGSMGHKGSKGGKASTGGGCAQCPPQLVAFAESLWQSGSLHVALSAPRTTYGRWRIKFEPPVAPEMAGQVLVFTLDWVGNILFYHECMRRAMSAPQSVAPLISMFQAGQDMSHNKNPLHGKINYIAISTYEQIRAFDLDPEQRNVCDHINTSTVGMFYINALAGVGKTSLITAILFWAAMNYKGQGHNEVVLVLVPSRELRYDLCQDVLNTGVFDDTEVLWLGRPPPGRTYGIWEVAWLTPCVNSQKIRCRSWTA